MAESDLLLVEQLHQRPAGARLRLYRAPPACGLIANLAEAVGRSRPIWIGAWQFGAENLAYWRQTQFGSSMDLRDPRAAAIAGGGILIDPTQDELDLALADTGEWDIFQFVHAPELHWRGATPLRYILDVGDRPGRQPRPRAVPEHPLPG